MIIDAALHFVGLVNKESFRYTSIERQPRITTYVCAVLRQTLNEQPVIFLIGLQHGYRLVRKYFIVFLIRTVGIAVNYVHYKSLYVVLLLS